MELIVAFAKNNIIGNNDKIPWHIPEDLIRFRHMTQGNVIVMGRKTFESFPNGPLKDRIHIVLTRTPTSHITTSTTTYPNVFFVNTENLRETLEPYSKTKKIFVIGGREIYDLLLDYCESIHITLVDLEPEGDVVFSNNLDYFVKNYSLFYESNLFKSKKDGVKYKYFTFYKK
jgi:dihydrofolate reductase